MGEAGKNHASELPMETMDDFIRLIYVGTVWLQKKDAISVEKAEGANKISGGFDFPDFYDHKTLMTAYSRGRKQNGFIKWHAAEGSG